MALDAAKWQIQLDKDVRYIGPDHTEEGANWVTVLDLHRWLQDKADDASMSSDDYMDITRDTPSDKSFETIINLVNGYNIDDATAEFIYGGSIIQAGGDVIYDGIQVIASVGCHVEIVQDGAIINDDWWNSIPHGLSAKGINSDVANGISSRFMVKVRTGGIDTDGRRVILQTREWGKTYSEFKVNGTGRGVNVAPLTYADDLNNATPSGTVAGWTTITNTEGYRNIDVNNDTIAERYYSEWNKDTYSINQFYERMKYLTRRETSSTLYGLNGELFRGITHEIIVDTLTGAFSAAEAVSWSGGAGQMLARVFPDTGAGALTINVVAVAKTFTRTTGSFIADGFKKGMTIVTSGFTNGGNNTTKIIASVTTDVITVTSDVGLVDESGNNNERIKSGHMWIQLLTGVAPTDNQTVLGGTSAATCLVNVTVTERTLSFPFCGASTGSSIIGAYGFCLEALDLGASDKVFDLNNDLYQAPNYVTFTVGGLLASHDYVLVAPEDSGAIKLNQFTLNGLLNGAAVTSVVINGEIPVDTPGTGTIRILRISGKYTRHPYSFWAGSTFTIEEHNFSGDNAANGANVFISYIDSLITEGTTKSYTAVYWTGNPRNLYIRVRDGGASPIKTFETTGVCGEAGGSATAIRNSDE